MLARQNQFDIFTSSNQFIQPELLMQRYVGKEDLSRKEIWIQPVMVRIHGFTFDFVAESLSQFKKSISVAAEEDLYKLSNI